jgi:hypothetical protein
MIGGVVVRVTNRSENVQSFGVSNEAGILVMPLPVGRHCYDAFSEKGVALSMRRVSKDRCFSIENTLVQNSLSPQARKRKALL